MLKFFRQIRHRLLAESKISSYLLYAIGEILLVVIGILIALQINNWNEIRKDIKKELIFLKDIKEDLQQDTIQINQIIQANRQRLSYYKLIDPEFNLRNQYIIPVADTTLRFRRLLTTARSFRPTKGSYTSLLADGQSQLIRNRGLFKIIQQVYDEDYPRINALHQALVHSADHFKIKRNYEIRYTPYNNMSDITDRELVAELSHIHTFIKFYTNSLDRHKIKITETIEKIEEELQK